MVTPLNAWEKLKKLTYLSTLLLVASFWQNGILNLIPCNCGKPRKQPAAATGCCTLNLTHLCEASLQKSETNTSALAGLTHTCRGLANFNYPELVRLSIAYFPQATLPNFATTANIVSCHFQANTAPYN